MQQSQLYKELQQRRIKHTLLQLIDTVKVLAIFTVVAFVFVVGLIYLQGLILG